MKKIPWIYISLLSTVIAFFVLWLLIGNVKASLLLSILTGAITLFYNPVTRYMRAFWSVLSILVTTNTFSLKIALYFFNQESIGNIETNIGTSSVVLTIVLLLLCALLLVLDHFERNDKPIFSWSKMNLKGLNNSSNFQAIRDQTITDNKKIQNGGDNSQLIQASKMVINYGIDEKRAREIYQEMNLKLKKDYTQEALEIANARVSKFKNSLMPKMEAVDGALEAFADPSFQLLLVEAQKTAAATERSVDYGLLSELLIHRFQKGENRTARAAINRAVEIVDNISDEALLGLTVAHAISSFSPSKGDINQGLDTLNELFGKLFYDLLPTGQNWLDHLDILDAVRLIPFGKLKTTQQIYTGNLNGYIEAGIEKGSENFKKAIEILNTFSLPQNFLIDNIFNEDFVRLNVPNRHEINRLVFQGRNKINNSITQIPLTEDQKNALNFIHDLYKQDGNVKNENVKKFMEEWDKRSNLKILREWWDNIETSFQITSVGKVLAHSNAQRCDKELPPLN
ncbi:MAG: LPO_1073/Vpar_1526 family protein [Bacteroidota bacterium]